MRSVVAIAAFWFGLFASFEPMLIDPREGALLAPPPKPMVIPSLDNDPRMIRMLQAAQEGLKAQLRAPLADGCGPPDICVHARRRTP